MTEIVLTVGASPGISLGVGGSGIALGVVPPSISLGIGAGQRRIFDVVFGAASLTPTTTDRWLFPGYANSNARTIPLNRPSPFDGVLKLLRVIHNDPGGNGGAITYTVMINGAPTALSVTMASTDSAGVNLTDQVAVSKGDLVCLKAAKAASIGGGLSDIIAGMVLQV